MHAAVGDRLHVHSRTVGVPDETSEIIEVRGPSGEPPYLVRRRTGPKENHQGHGFLEQNLNVLIANEVANKIDAETSFGQSSRSRNHRPQPFGRDHCAAEHAQSARIGHRGRQFGARDESHPGIDDGRLKRELPGDSGLQHVGFSIRFGKPIPDPGQVRH